MDAGRPLWEDEIADAVARAARAVARVEGRSRLPASGLVWSPDGIIVTANHVLERDEGVRVQLPDGRPFEAALIGRDPATDVALLRVAEIGLEAADWIDLGGVRLGHTALVVARSADGPEAARGIVAGLQGAWRTALGGSIDACLRTDCPLRPGYSGGALTTRTGRVLGMVTSGLAPGTSLAIPTATLRRVATALLEHGRIRRGYLGLTVLPARLPHPAARELGRPEGLLVASVADAGPSEQAGVTVGDLLLSVDGEPLASVDALQDRLTPDRIGGTLAMYLLRDGKRIEVRVTVTERPR